MTDEPQQHSEPGSLLNWGCLMLLVVFGGLATMLYGLGVLIFGDTPASSAVTVLLAGLGASVLGVAVIKRFPDAVQMKGYAPSARVTRLAAERSLGEHVLTRKNTSPLEIVAGTVSIGAVIVGALWGVNWVLSKTGTDIPGLQKLATTVVLCLLTALVLVIIALPVLLWRMPKGFVRTHLYASGLVYTSYGRPRAVTWDDVDRLVLSRQAHRAHPFGGKVLAYHVITHDGHRLRIDAHPHLESDPLGAHMLNAVQLRRRPILEGGPAAGDPGHRRI
ncbi:DUF6585 family protein [Streptomyces cinereospinus]|uniref:DUF6585 family protein n=1 Tax=Streptomyces cinereospinus TaxID=285561 RepID=A0ABV5N872_9ACTN